MCLVVCGWAERVTDCTVSQWGSKEVAPSLYDQPGTQGGKAWGRPLNGTLMVCFATVVRR